nr:hemerythrin family protein [uncultured Dongia sp.]
MYALTEAMLTGVARLDSEHQDLVTVINRIDAAEQNGDAPEVVVQLTAFKDALFRHFRSEEDYLDMESYPRKHAHESHHTGTIKTLEEMTDKVRSDPATLGKIAVNCFTELLRNVLLMDMEFLNWRAEQDRRQPRDR